MNSNRPLKICHVITRMIVGGAQENTLATVRGHLAHGNPTTLVTGPSPGREGQLLEHLALAPENVAVFPELVREISPYDDTAAFFRLRRFFIEHKFDVVHTHTSKAGIIGRLAARSAGVPVVVHTVHGQAFHPYQSPWKNRLFIAAERLAASRCDRIYTVAQAMIDQCVAAHIAPREKYQVVYSGMDMSRFTAAKRDPELRAKLRIPEDARVIATLARLSPQKGYEFVIPAAAEIIRRFPGTLLLIIGDGSMHAQLLEQARAAGIGQAVRFAGLIPPDQVPDYLAQADLLWHLSLHEGLPRSVVQALAVGIPAIGFALDGTPEVILDGKTGFCVPPESIFDVVISTGKLWKNPELAREMGRRGQELVTGRFDIPLMVDTLETSYRQLLNAAVLRRGDLM
ncbi:MAG: glycosyltransferase family 4 protein [Victivallaceae bacterium]|nr:glycosyltransferase family 4 protein [Victivallaceae bacterium]